MRMSLKTFAGAIGMLALVAQLNAGGFWLTAGNPEASAEARAMKAVLTAKAMGCHNPEQAEFTGTAIGIVNGERRTVPLKLASLPDATMIAVTRQWPADGRWVIQLTGKYNGAVATLLVPAGPEGVDRYAAKQIRGEPKPEMIAALLQSGTAAVARK
ncbi:MAG TPA: hypothetical protein VN428_24310 [Bryobacteraceae bacterium]|nr:hypothetical protein [Bryobacteraceae bacterium]